MKSFLWPMWLLAALLSVESPAVLAQKLTPAPTTNAPSEPSSISVRTHLVSLTVAVLDKRGRHFTGLDKNSFTVFENSIAQEISFFGIDDGPATVAVVFDLSGSMGGAKIRRAREALARFVQTGHRDDEYSLVGFNEQVKLLLERSRAGESLPDLVASVKPRGGTALYDAVALGLAQVARGAWSKRALIVISDGEDNRSRLSFKALKQMTAEGDALIYSIVIKDWLTRPTSDSLPELAEATGGLAFFPADAEEIAEAFERIAVDLRQRYSIGYAPADFSADGRWRKLKVNITPPPNAPRLSVLTRKGYFADNTEAKLQESKTANE